MGARVDTNALCSLNQVKDYLGLKRGEPDKDRLLIDFINRASINIETYCSVVFKSAEYSELYSGDGDKRIYLYHVPIIAVKRIAIGRLAVIRVTNTSAATSAFIRVTSTGVVLTKDGTENATVTFATYTTLTTLVAAINAIGNWSATLQSTIYGAYQSSELLECHNKSCIDSSYVDLDTSNTPEEDYEVNVNEGYIYKSAGFGSGMNNVRVIYTAGYVAAPKDIVQACIETAAFMDKQGGDQAVLGFTAMSRTDGDSRSFEELLSGFLPQVKAVLDRHRTWNV